MIDEIVQQTIVRAVQQAYDGWAGEHPSLAAVIDRISLTESAVESLKDSTEYQQAIAAYHRDMSDVNLLNRLVELAAPLVTSLLAG